MNEQMSALIIFKFLAIGVYKKTKVKIHTYIHAYVPYNYVAT